jgi:3-oxosteroid 1-dehydrogenase
LKADEFDLVVVGSGGGGLAAALSAAGRGLSVCVLEKSDRIGGGTATSYGSMWAPANLLAARAGLADSIDDGLTYARYVAGGAELSEHLEAHVRNAPRVVERLVELGVKLRLALGLPDIFYPLAPGSRPDGRRMIEAEPIARAELGAWGDKLRHGHYIAPGVSWGDAASWGGFGNKRNWDPAELARRERAGLLAAGEGLIARLLAVYLRHGGRLELDAGATSLAVEEGRVCGVRVGASRTVRARCGVVLATGGYEGNPDLVKRFEGIPDWLNAFAPTNEGDGMVMATELGAAVYRLPVNHGLLVGCAIPTRNDEFFSIGLHGMPYPGAIAVNGQGRRFCDESLFQEVVRAFYQFDRASHRFVNLPAHMVFDERHRQRYSVAGGVPGAHAPEWVARGNTLGELAAKIGVDAAGLEQTVKRFNGHAATGEDPEFGRGKSAFSRSTAGGAKAEGQMKPLDLPPYYAIRLRVGGIVSAGVMIGTHGEVLHVRGHAIPGLYACGNAAAPTDTGVGYQGGSSIGSAMIFGFLAAEHAASRLTRS